MSEEERDKVKIRTTTSFENDQKNTSTLLKEGELACLSQGEIIYSFLGFNQVP